MAERRLTRAQEFKQKKDELREKMRAIKLFPGNLDEFAKANGGEYEIINLLGNEQFLEGGLLRWKGVDDDKPFIEKIVVLNPFKWIKLQLVRQEFYSEILVRAVELGADALIYYTKTYGHFGGYGETGVPIRRTDIPSNPQK